MDVQFIFANADSMLSSRTYVQTGVDRCRHCTKISTYLLYTLFDPPLPPSTLQTDVVPREVILVAKYAEKNTRFFAS